LRLSTPDEWRFRAIAGAFWEDNELLDQTGLGLQERSFVYFERPAGNAR